MYGFVNSSVRRKVNSFLPETLNNYFLKPKRAVVKYQIQPRDFLIKVFSRDNTSLVTRRPRTRVNSKRTFYFLSEHYKIGCCNCLKISSKFVLLQQLPTENMLAHGNNNVRVFTDQHFVLF